MEQYFALDSTTGLPASYPRYHWSSISLHRSIQPDGPGIAHPRYRPIFLLSRRNNHVCNDPFRANVW